MDGNFTFLFLYPGLIGTWFGISFSQNDCNSREIKRENFDSIDLEAVIRFDRVLSGYFMMVNDLWIINPDKVH